MRLVRLAACVAALFAAAGLAQAAPPGSAEIEQALKRNDRAELQALFARMRQDAGSVDPLYLMVMSLHLQQLGQPEDAVFWFLAGQLRTRYLLSVAPDENRSLVFASMMMGLGTAIYAPYQNDMDRVAAVVDRVLAWDKAAPVDFAWLPPAKVKVPRDQWEARFIPIREGLVKLKAEFLAIPKDECARIAKSMGEIDYKKEREKSQASWAGESSRRRVEAGFSTAPTTVTTGGVSFRTTKNFLSPFAFPDVNDYQDREIIFHLFLPDLSGYTRENWVERLHPAKLQVSVLPNGRYSFMKTYAEQAARTGPLLREINGLKVYANPGAHRCFPEELAVGVLEGGEPVYVVCAITKEPVPACNAYFYGPGRAYQLSLPLWREQLSEWRELPTRVKTLLASWQHAAR